MKFYSDLGWDEATLQRSRSGPAAQGFGSTRCASGAWLRRDAGRCAQRDRETTGRSRRRGRWNCRPYLLLFAELLVARTGRRLWQHEPSAIVPVDRSGGRGRLRGPGGQGRSAFRGRSRRGRLESGEGRCDRRCGGLCPRTIPISIRAPSRPSCPRAIDRCRHLPKPISAILPPRIARSMRRPPIATHASAPAARSMFSRASKPAAAWWYRARDRRTRLRFRSRMPIGARCFCVGATTTRPSRNSNSRTKKARISPIRWRCGAKR